MPRRAQLPKCDLVTYGQFLALESIPQVGIVFRPVTFRHIELKLGSHFARNFSPFPE